MKKITFVLALLCTFLGFAQFPTPGVEGFENTTNPDVATNPSPWTLGTGATGNQWAVFDNGVGTARRWTITTSAANVYAGTNSAFMNNENIGQGNTSEDYLATPKVTVPTNGELHFWTRSTLTGPQGTEYFVLVNPTATAGTQTNIASYTVTAQTYTEATLSTTFNVYEEKVVDLSAYAGQQVYIAFMMRFTQPTTALGGDRWLIDSVSLVERCLVPNNLSATSITQTSALLGWTGTAPQYEVEVVPATGIPTGSGVIVTTNSYSAQGLTPATPYVYYVRALCSQSNSAWVGPFNFTTATPGLTCTSAIAIPNLPYSTNDNTSVYADTNDTNQGGSCGSTTNYMIGNEVYYSYTPTTTGAISITMTPGASNSGIFVYQGCNNVGVNCVAGVADATSGVRNIPSLNVIAGQTYIIVLSSSAATQSYSYSLIIQQLNCAQPDALTATGISLTGATLSWGNPGNASSWEYVVQTSGSAIPSGSGTTVTTNAGTPVTGLNPDTAYQYWVRADCGNGTFSAWAGPYVFNTLVPPPVCGGTYTDGGGAAANYANNADQTVTICPQTVGDVVTVTFTSFNVEATNDGLYIFNGNSTSAPQIASANGAGAVPGGLAGAYWGTTNPGSFTSSSPDGCLTFRFRSNATTTAAGWVANVTCAAPPACPAPFSLTPTVVLGTSATFTWTAGGTENQWEIIAQPCGNAAPTATTVGTVVNTNTYTIQNLNGLTCYDVYVRAICTSPDVSTWTGPVSITTQVAPPACGGVFSDPGGNANYDNSTDSTVTICPTAPGDVVTVNFTFFATEANWDGLYVFNGNSINAPQISSTNGAGNVPGGLPGSYWGTLTGANLPSFTSTSPDGCLTFRFRSDTSVTAAGWLANVICAPPPTCPNPNTLITSNITHNSATLAWTNPNTATTWNVIALPCGSPAPTAATTGFTVVTTNPYTFTGLTPDTCYDLYVQAVCGAGDLSYWIGPSPITTQIAPPVCGAVFTDPAGANANYANNTDYTVTICPTIPGEQVTVTFTTFNTEANWDGLYVFDGDTINAQQIASNNPANNVPGGLPGSYWGNLTGANLPGPFTASSASGCLTFRFRSDGSVTNPGWVADVTCAPPPTCPKPSNVTVTNITTTTAQIAWNEIGTATQWEVLILPAGSPAPTAASTGIIVNTNPYIATGLNPATQYIVYVRSICSASDISLWSNVKAFNTIIANDECLNATVTPVNTSTTCTVFSSGSLIGATASSEPNTCGGTDDDDVWFSFTATSTTHTINLNNITGGTTDLFHVLYSGTCGNLTQLYCSDPNNSIANNLTPGQTYYIRIYSWTATANQTSSFQVCIGTPQPPPSCITNTPAGNTCAEATPICNLNGYCGNTSASYTSNSWPQLSAAFCGSLENNSFLSFVAADTTISFDVWVTSSEDANGIQIMVFGADTCGSGPVTEYTCWSPGDVLPGSTNITATGLTVGQTYYIMIDGFAGDVCDYVIASNSGIQAPVEITTSTNTTTPTICLGQTATLNASGGNGQFTWATPSGSLSATTGASVVFTPPGVGTFNITATSTDNNPNCPQSASSTQTITVVDYFSTTFDAFPSFCTGSTFPDLPSQSNEGVTGTWSPATIQDVVGTTTYTFTPDVTFCTNPTTLNVTIDPLTTPTFITPAPICPGSPAPLLPTTSGNGITGTWNPAVVSNTASGTYTFTPDAGQCGATVSMSITVLPSCDFGSYANAVWLTNCQTSDFFNTQGSGTDIIGPAQNVFPNSDLGTYVQNSGTLKLRGAEVKTFKSVTANVCSARLYYRIYPVAGTPGAFTSLDLPFFDDCTIDSDSNGTVDTYPSGGPCNPRDQKWQRVLSDIQSPIDLTAYTPGDYNLEVYYELTGDVDSPTQCDDTQLINNGGANFIATYTLQSTPVYASTNPTTCNGNDGTITITGLAPNTSYNFGYTYTIPSPPSSYIADNNGQIVITGLTAGTYTNFNLNVNGCNMPNTTPIVLVDPTPPSVSVSDVTVCETTPATLTAVPSGTSTYSYVWTVPTGATNPGDVASFDATVSGNYTVTITDTVTNCTSNTATAVVVINTLVTPTFDAIAPLCLNATAPVLLTTSNNGITGTWTPSTIDTSVAGTFYIDFTPDAGQCAESVSITVVINSVPTPTATVTQQATCATPTGTAQVTSPLNVTSTVPSDLFISEVTDAETGSLTYVEIFNGTGTTKDLSNYKLKFYNNGNTFTSCDNQLSGLLANNTTVVIKVSSSANQGGVVPNLVFTSCGGVNDNDNIRLTTSTDVEIDVWGDITGTSFTPANAAGYVYRRNTNASPVPTTTWTPSQWTALDPEDYSDVGTYTPVTVPVQYEYAVDNGTYQSSPVFSGLTPGSHTITVRDLATGCVSLPVTVVIDTPALLPAVTTISYTSPVCANAVSTLTPNTSTVGFTAGGQYTADSANLSINPSTGVIDVASSQPGSYVVTYTVAQNIASCQDGGSSTTTVVINPQPTVSVNNATVCQGQTATVTATPGDSDTYSYVWTYPVGAADPGNVASFTTTIAGTYSVVITSTTTGCVSNSASGTVTVNANPIVTVNSSTVCQGQSATVVATPDVTGSYTYVWTVPTGATNPGNVSTFTTTTAGNYSVVITNTATGCTSASGSGTVTVNPLPTVSVANVTVCTGAAATVTATPGTAGTYTFAWTVPTGATNPGNVDTFTTTVAGTYSVIITDTTTGCTSTSASGSVTINPAFSFEIEDGCVGNNYMLEVKPLNNSFDPATAQYDWEIINGSIPVAVGNDEPTFNVTSYLNSTPASETLPLTFGVTVTDANGCTQYSTIVLTTIYCEIQRGISPNGDGLNDFFDLEQLGVKNLSIYNRYGTKVYSKSSYTNQWVGQSDNSDELPDGTYFYVIEFNSGEASKTGWIYINREVK
ncbi:fibronectin type III domain-containing protein [Flavobacterium stagni]|uniref:T9SS type B sorting domain-containing protein n=1 Tax=Flavobacterium stagni TaxID=2506421 RepID=A0A4Q1KBP0_9FLAO|nr:fibronectin type III domain-containing protein [Flavobacterium stagni]RXR24287.1 T9SS type B sorting domain-containing protein [Flavobacterium stagni]